MLLLHINPCLMLYNLCCCRQAFPASAKKLGDELVATLQQQMRLWTTGVMCMLPVLAVTASQLCMLQQ